MATVRVVTIMLYCFASFSLGEIYVPYIFMAKIIGMLTRISGIFCLHLDMFEFMPSGTKVCNKDTLWLHVIMGSPPHM